MKIAFIIDSLRRHGTQRFLVHLARGLRKLSYAQKVIALNNASDPDIEKALLFAGCEITRVGKYAFLSGGIGWWRLVVALKVSEPDVVMTMLDFADTLGRPAARLAGCRVLVTSIRVRNITKPSWRRWVDGKTIAWAAKVIFNSEQVADYACQNEGVQKNQVVVIPNGVEDLRARSGALRDEHRRKLHLHSETVLLGWVGRLHRQKNLSLFLRALTKLSAAREWKVLVIGEGPERSRLLSLARELNLTDRLTWLGARDDVEAWLSATDLFVHTADFEGMPNAVMEAMAMGLPVVASAVDGNRELIRDGVSGYLVPPGDADAFAKRIDEVIDDVDLARRLGEQAHREVLERFPMDRMIDAYHHLFLSLTNLKTPDDQSR